MNSDSQLQLYPTQLTVHIDGVTIEATTWRRVLQLLSQQSAIRRYPLHFGIYDSDRTVIARQVIDPQGKYSTESGEEKATVTLDQWSIFNSHGNEIIAFPTLEVAKHHIQLISDICHAAISIEVKGQAPEHSEQHSFLPAGISTGSIASISQEELESNLLATDLEVREQERSEENAPAPEEPLVSAPAVFTETVPSGTAPDEPITEKHEQVATEEPEYLFEDEEPTPVKSPWYSKPLDKARQIELPLFLDSTRNKVLLGAGVATLLLSAVGISALIASNTDSLATAKLTDTSLSVPAGYSDQPVWSLNIPQDAQVKATRTVTAFITADTLTLYSSNTGEKIREIKLTSPITTFGEVRIDGEDGIVWRTGNTVNAWTDYIGSQGKLITANVPADTKLSGSGEALLATTSDATKVLTKDGFKAYKIPAGLSAMAATEQNVVAGSFSPEVYLLDSAGNKTKETTLQAPHEGQSLYAWKHADESITATIWADNPDAVCTEADNSGCDEKATVAVHSLDDGHLTTSYDTTLANVNNLQWVDGEGDLYGGFGRYVIDEKTGEQITALPQDLTAERIKGNFILSTESKGNKVAFHGADNGYLLTSVLLAETKSSVILQQGDKIVVYPLASV